jgi:DedD protein
MEKKKLLLVAVSVGVFLVIVISAAVLVFNPRSAPVQSTAPILSEYSGSSRSATADPSNMVGNPELNQLRDPSLPSPIQENTIYINGDPGSKLTLDRSDDAVTTTTVISIPKPASAAVPTAPAKEPPKPAAQPAQTVVKAAPAAAKPAASVAPPKKSYNDFWVQAGSYSTRDRADKVKKTLDDKGITSIITNQEINGQTYYRVRVGPYTSRNEADYWLVMVKSIEGFEGSQVWESQSNR